ncbi:DUF192 domain-containing protein [Hoeflea sp. WL0058]|uniref:DUF192 domain-containing protein n=1 Tax=Flavimaribacter sediminis TaxID=2865987 RepID=A0AAE2ZMM2_9HYPH|nr:DUF192 domain-containing protein [Flavimaribacter sediminis]MBW8637108.1 DUF192 domain-containing protein [Flavimaribacter sediminis]
MQVFGRRAAHCWLALFIVFLAASSAFAQTREDGSSLQIITDSGCYEFTVELALTPAQRQVGLMNRQHLDDRAGMLFRFDQVRPVTMWMRNTLIPLDMIFIRSDGEIAHIHQNARPLDESVISSREPVAYVLEVNGGKTAELGVKPGHRVSHPLIAQ